MNNQIVNTIKNYYIKQNKYNISVGDHVTVSSILSKKLKRKQIFSGIIVSIKKNKTFTVRNIISKTFIDRTYNLNSNLLMNINIIKKNLNYKHSKLYNVYPRKPISQSNN